MSTAFPAGGRSIVERMTQQFPELFVNEDDKQRQLTAKIGQQFAFTYGPAWGNKKRTGLPDASMSKDSVAVREPDGTTSVWDMFSSGLAILVNDGDLPVPGTHANLPPSAATFMACAPFDYLSAGSVPPAAGQDPALAARVAALETEVALQQDEIDGLRVATEADRARLEALEGRVLSLEQHALQDTDALRVAGRTESSGVGPFRHSHGVNLPVTRG